MARIYHDDTIAAIATPLGEGAIAVIRVSGSDSVKIVDQLFRGRSKLSEASGYTAHYGKLLDANHVRVDDVVVTVFRGPHSYTGEDSVEVSCHGGLYSTKKTLATILFAGVRQAEPGEFTKRAFLNGKMDLSQAEAVADLIASRSEAFHRASLNQLEGRFSGEIKKLRSELLNLGSLLELELDFSEDGVDLISRSEVIRRIQSAKSQIKKMIDSYRLGKLCRDGASVVIAGKPNAGKSSLFNALLKEDRAIVTEIAGTTRDSLEESLSISGVTFKLNDTAGLRETEERIEIEGVRRTKKLLSHADALLLVIDASSGPDRNEAISFLNGIDPPKIVIVVYNKIDLCEHCQLPSGEFNIESSGCSEVLASAMTGIGVDEIRSRLLSRVLGSDVELDGSQVTNIRHRDSLRDALESLGNAEVAVERATSNEFVALDVKTASDSLSSIIGDVSTDEMLNNIFRSFCIGK